MKKDYAEKITYSKAPLSLKTQISKLKKRGLIINDEKSAADYLFNISYYRLRAYTYPFQENTDPEADHKFIRTVVISQRNGISYKLDATMALERIVPQKGLR